MILVNAAHDMQPELWQQKLGQIFGKDKVFLPDSFDPDAIRYMVTWKPDPLVLAKLTKLEMIFSLGAGVDHLLCLPNLPDVPIVRTVNDDLSQQMVHYVVWRVLALHRADERLRYGQAHKLWLQPAPNTWVAKDLRIGILGFGHLGEAVAKPLVDLGFDVYGWSRSSRTHPDVTCYHGDDQRDAFLEKCYILVVLLPLTPKTQGIINEDLLSKLAKDSPLGGAVLINAGRGLLQDEAAIIKALDKGALIHASLDVFCQEPLPEDSPLWTHPNVYITPHIAAQSNVDAVANDVVTAIRDYESGKPLANLVDPSRGY